MFDQRMGMETASTGHEYLAGRQVIQGALDAERECFSLPVLTATVLGGIYFDCF